MLCRAAVVGKWFSYAALAAMAEPGDGPLDADLDRLVTTGLIERLLYRQDRRVRLLRLTQAAHPLIDDIMAIGSATRGQALDGVSEEDRDRLFDILSRMKSNLHRPPGQQRVRRLGHDQ